jgi:hypothetical protein
MTARFHCGGELESWVPTDDSWQQHGYWFPCCVYVRFVWGQDFYAIARSIANPNSLETMSQTSCNIYNGFFYLISWRKNIIPKKT